MTKKDYPYINALLEARQVLNLQVQRFEQHYGVSLVNNAPANAKRIFVFDLEGLYKLRDALDLNDQKIEIVPLNTLTIHQFYLDDITFFTIEEK